MIFSYLLNMQSHPSWVCGLKHSFTNCSDRLQESHPSWVCGLKQNAIFYHCIEYSVTPFVGVWIETSQSVSVACSGSVTPFVGVWIETDAVMIVAQNIMSHPSWVCGLKLNKDYGREQN